MGAKRKRSSSSTRAAEPKTISNRKSTTKVDSEASYNNKPTTNSLNRQDTKKTTIKTKGSQQVKYNVGEQVQYDPVHKGSTRRAQGKVTKILTGAKKSDPSTKEVRYIIENDNTGKETSQLF
ncbi:unnamed protein product [Rotaria sp. Silwood2]|nr:unnamed protein product [Rotaria sp. Silwood2]CAF3081898.1 unnamed protein product [Rotaria sp. Silwood2]CAF3088707.1 unnamed protein product [Rotaria sp. Silwood2]CAF3992157.1 unnamed protein product [Rotaria sp. Silwood2]CAF4358256.1 unnamed protein product [Rotaria sp. Silwood2]